jgi:tetratricopeptide (TPR) repeat protein
MAMSRRGRILHGVAGLLLLPLLSRPAWGGIYNLADPQPPLIPLSALGRTAPPFEKVNDGVAGLGTVRDGVRGPTGPTALRQAYEAQEAELRRLKHSRGLTTSETVSFTACLLRMGRHPEALVVLDEALRRATPDDPGRFLLLLHQAMAYDQQPELRQRALDTQEQALKSWPGLWAGWSREELTWHCRAEKYQLQLMKQRQLQERPGDGQRLKETIDAIFPRVRFVGVSGRYEAGGIAPAQMAELPPDAEALVVQLFLWQPTDPRLRWLYAELLNARGQVPPALKFLTVSSDEGLSSIAEVRLHRRILAESLKAWEQLQNRDTLRQLLWLGSARPGSSGVGIAPALVELPALAPLRQAEPVIPGGTVPPGPASGTALPDWQVLGTGIFAGVFLALIGVFQVQHWQRRKARLPHP